MMRIIQLTTLLLALSLVTVPLLLAAPIMDVTTDGVLTRVAGPRTTARRQPMVTDNAGGRGDPQTCARCGGYRGGSWICHPQDLSDDLIKVHAEVIYLCGYDCYRKHAADHWPQTMTDKVCTAYGATFAEVADRDWFTVTAREIWLGQKGAPGAKLLCSYTPGEDIRHVDARVSSLPARDGTRYLEEMRNDAGVLRRALGHTAEWLVGEQLDNSITESPAPAAQRIAEAKHDATEMLEKRLSKSAVFQAVTEAFSSAHDLETIAERAPRLRDLAARRPNIALWWSYQDSPWYQQNVHKNPVPADASAKVVVERLMYRLHLDPEGLQVYEQLPPTYIRRMFEQGRSHQIGQIIDLLSDIEEALPSGPVLWQISVVAHRQRVALTAHPTARRIVVLAARESEKLIEHDDLQEILAEEFPRVFAALGDYDFDRNFLQIDSWDKAVRHASRAAQLGPASAVSYATEHTGRLVSGQFHRK